MFCWDKRTRGWAFRNKRRRREIKTKLPEIVISSLKILKHSNNHVFFLSYHSICIHQLHNKCIMSFASKDNEPSGISALVHVVQVLVRQNRENSLLAAKSSQDEAAWGWVEWAQVLHFNIHFSKGNYTCFQLSWIHDSNRFGMLNVCTMFIIS